MAQSGYTPIQLYYSATSTNVPLAANLIAGELAINTADGKLFYKDSGGTVQTIASQASTLNVSSITFGSTGLTPATATTGVVSVGGILVGTNGGTGVNNGASTITIGGNVTMSGAFTFAGTLTANTAVTFPTTGTLVNSAVTTLSSLASIGTITTGTWNGSVIGAAYGGTGVANNAASTITISGSFGTTFTVTGTTSVTLPTSGTLVNSAVTTLSSLVSVGTITTGTWSASTISAARGGTGVANNAASTLTISGNFGTTLTVSGTTALTLPTSGTVTTNDGTVTLTNKRIDPRVLSATSASSVTPDVASYDMYAYTALAATLTINAPTGTPVNGTKLMFRILDNGSAQTLTWNATYTVIGTTLPTATTAGKMVYVGCIYNAANTRWDVVAIATQA